MANKGWKIAIGVMAVILVLLIAIAVFFLMDREYTVDIQLEGAEEITLEYDEDFADPGAKAWLHCNLPVIKAKSLEVVTEGEADLQKLGTYEITYTASGEGAFGKTTRKVTVVDTVAPEIELVGDPDKRTPIGQTYEEEGFTARDNYDGDLTANVVTTMSDNTVIYEVTDSSGNRTQVTREIVYYDPDPPVITLRGSRNMVLIAGETYQEPGCTAVDAADGDVSKNVQISGSVDTETAGTYKVTYSVADSHGNQASATRQVKVIKYDPEHPAAPNGKTIYLTFDDGPGEHTDKLLDVLKKYNVKATFFVVNTGSISKIKREAAEGHTVAIHSYTHKFESVYKSEAAYYNDLNKMSDTIASYTGQTPKILRFPGGSSNTLSKKYCKGIMTVLTKSVEGKGYRYFDWNVDSNDAGGATSAETVFNNVVSGCEGRTNSVVLQHDIKGFSVDAVERIIVWGLSNGYTFKPLSADSPQCHHKPLN